MTQADQTHEQMRAELEGIAKDADKKIAPKETAPSIKEIKPLKKSKLKIITSATGHFLQSAASATAALGLIAFLNTYDVSIGISFNISAKSSDETASVTRAPTLTTSKRPVLRPTN